MTIRTSPLSLTINGEAVGPVDVPDDLMMVDFLHEYARLTGPRFGCGVGQCRACVVLLDTSAGSSEIRTCITGAHFFEGKRIRTIEGLATRDSDSRVIRLTNVQQKFLEHFSFQCGYCTPGFVIAATALVERLQRQPIAAADVESEVSRALEPHLCRCTGYVRYYQAVKDVVLTTPGLTLKE